MRLLDADSFKRSKVEQTMLDELFGDDEVDLKKRARVETYKKSVYSWKLGDIKNYLTYKQSFDGVGFGEEGVLAILMRFYDNTRPDGSPEFENKLDGKEGKKFIPQRTQTILRIFEKIAKAPFVTSRMIKVMKAVAENTKNTDGNAEYKEDILPMLDKAEEMMHAKKVVSAKLSVK